jgi:hypothetical protein
MKRFFSLLTFLTFLSSLAFSQERPFKVGETLSYEGKFSRAVFRGINVADLDFTIKNAPNNKDLVITAEAKSKGTVLKLFRFSFIQNIESLIDGEKFRALKTTKRDQQKERIRDSVALMDYGEKRVIYTESDPKDISKSPRKIASKIEDETHDIISSIYRLRLLPLAVGKSFEITVSDSGLVYQIPVRVTARERQNSILGKVWCFRVEPEVFGVNRFIEQKGSMIIWITDDKQRLPVRSQINAEIGKIDVKLKRFAPEPPKL